MNLTPADFSGFVHTADGVLVDGRGEPLLLRGFGLGNWMLPEGYMWKFEEPGPQSPRQIEALVVDMVGPERAAQFWQGFHDRFITADDIARMAAEGMNHVRLPINSRLVVDDSGAFLEDGFALIDRLIGWCREHGLWVVLDLHGAPGGQTGTNIDDSLGTPALFEEDRNRELTLDLWRYIARRYRDETVVAGYDLLNEPLPNEYQYTYADRLVSLYLDLTAVIREEDPNHLIIYEGSQWATNWDMFTEVWDPNSMLQFHRYWSPPDRDGVQRFLDARERLGLPIYMGEGGENNNDWIQTSFTLYEEYDISWNFWPWKKIRTLTSPCSIEPPAGWDDVLAYAAGKAERPDPEAAWSTLAGLLDQSDLSRCVWRADLMSSLLRRVPVRFPAWGFGFRGAGVSYQTASASPLPGFRADDQVTILASRAPDGEPGFHHTDGSPRDADDTLLVAIAADEWLDYTFVLARAARLEVTVATSGPGTSPAVLIDGAPVTASAAYPPGEHRLRLVGTAGGALLDWLEVTTIARDAQ